MKAAIGFQHHGANARQIGMSRAAHDGANFFFGNPRTPHRGMKELSFMQQQLRLAIDQMFGARKSGRGFRERELQDNENNESQQPLRQRDILRGDHAGERRTERHRYDQIEGVKLRKRAMARNTDHEQHQGIGEQRDDRGARERFPSAEKDILQSDGRSPFLSETGPARLGCATAPRS